VASTVQAAPARLQSRSTAAPVPTTIRAAIRAINLWHLLSLDAPSVAALWTWFLAASNHIHLPLTVTLAMAVTVWTLYAADRLLDVRQLAAGASSNRCRKAASQLEELEARHLFHYRHRRGFRAGIVLCSLLLALLLPQLAPASIRLYLFLGSLLAGYFLLIHMSRTSDAGPGSRGRRIPKELAVGVFFSAAIFIPTIAREPGLRPTLFPAALLVALLCSLNCLFIYAWEHPVPTPRTHPATRLALRFLHPLTLTAALSGLILSVLSPRLPGFLPCWPIPAATALSALLLLLLDRLRRSHRLAPTTLRAAADLCLLTPLPLLPFLRS
jgi:hypothetical protein